MNNHNEQYDKDIMPATYIRSKRILIVNPFPIGANCPTGIMMKNLFYNYEANNILQYYTNKCAINDGISYTAKQIHISIRLPYTLILIKIIRRAISTSKKLMNKLLNSNSRDRECHETQKDHRLRATGYNNQSIGAWEDMIYNVNIEKQIIQEINIFKPEVIYTQVHSYRMLKYVIKIARITMCPIVVHTLDDWMNTTYKKSWISTIPLLYFDKLFGKILNNGKMHMVGSLAMLSYMKNRYGGQYEFIANCSTYSEMPSKRNNKIKKVVYTGGLMLERYLVLDQIAKSINIINSKGKLYEMHIYAPKEHIDGYKKYMQTSIVFHDSIANDDVINILDESDVLVHVESFSPNVINYTKYSLSTKIPEYLASGRPLIYYGPWDVGVACFLRKNKIGIQVQSNSRLIDVLLQLFYDVEYYNETARAGYRIGREYFDSTIMRRKFMKCI